MRNKLKALVQWFVALEVEEHRHWCDNRECPRQHNSVCWYCTGALCSGVERKNCPACTGIPDPNFRENSGHDAWLYRMKWEAEHPKERAGK